MNQFQYVRPAEVPAAAKAFTKGSNTHFLAGGTNLIDLMKMGVVVPERLVDINHLPLKKIEKTPGGISIGALATNTEISIHPLIKEGFPLLSLAINAGASPQLRNMATVGGNLMQRTRCPYFFDTTMPCNKRVPGSGCGALAGFNRMHAIFGASDKCIAVNPSDMNVALTALDATVHVIGLKGKRAIKFADFHRLPGEHPELDNTLQKGELITSVDIPASPYNKNVYYLKVRDRTSYAFALVSAGVALNIENNTIQGARLAMGGVAHKPWRLTETEAFLKGKPVSLDVFKQASQIAMQGARAYEYNKFKLKLAPNTILQALTTAAGLKA
ncbi:MAG: FAD-binding molybdopterin dehydrogenase [Mucilaginibacter sp.]|nr:FAD-binding molybdopterin dehydrogenase [Mucilaginibacter sp.]